jgi:hypothetical protein
MERLVRRPTLTASTAGIGLEIARRPMTVRPRKGRGAEQNRALRLLAGSPLGCTEAIMLAHGFTVETLGSLVLDGHATATPGIMYAGGRPITVTWLTITDVGRQALAGI